MKYRARHNSPFRPNWCLLIVLTICFVVWVGTVSVIRGYMDTRHPSTGNPVSATPYSG